MTGALGEIASRIDKGFSFEIRAAKPAALKNGEEETQDAQAARSLVENQYSEIIAQQPSLQFLKTDGPPILSLPGLPEGDGKKTETAT